MPIDSWLVEEEVVADPTQKPDIRAIYIRLLEQVIGALKEPMFPPGTVKSELEGPHFGIPTVIFAHFDTTGPHDSATARLYCYRDRREFLKDLRSFGDEDLIRQHDLESFMAAKLSPPEKQ